jgi:hypothetical protein
VRRGASWTAAYHLQPTVAAAAEPVRSSVVPSSSVLVSGPGRRPPSRRLPGGAASRHPASGVVAGVDTARTLRGVGHRCPTRGVHPAGCVVRDLAVQPAGVRPVRCPAGCCPPRSVRSRPSPPTSGCSVGDQVETAGQPSPQQPGRGRCGGRAVGRLGRRPSSPGGRATLPRSRGGQQGGRWRTRARIGAGGGRACPLRGQAGQAGAGSPLWLALWAGEQAGARVGRSGRVTAVSGWAGDHGGWWSWRRPVRVVPARGAGGDRGAAPARPRLAADVPGSLVAAL